MTAANLDDAALDAARDLVLAYGVRRTTLTDVARRAGISRMSIYRRWPDVGTLVADLMSRELHTLMMGVTAKVRTNRGLSREVGYLVETVRALREHPLLRKIREVDPETLVPYLLDRRGTSQQEMLALLEEAVRAGQERGVVRSGDAGLIARTVLLTLHSFVLLIPVAADSAYPVENLDAELGVLLRRYLAP